MKLRLGLRARFLLVTVLIVVSVDLAAGVFLETKLRAAQNQRIETDISRYTRTARDVIQTELAAGELGLDPEAIDPIADRLGTSLDARVTIIGVDGRVLGDSSLALAELATVENHATRPEVTEAKLDACGLARRHSSTLGEEMLYCAIAFELPPAPGQPPGQSPGRAYVRVATFLEVVDDSLRQLRLSLLLGGLLALGLSIGAGLVASRALYGKLRELVEAAEAVTEGDEATLAERRTDEVGEAVGTLNRLSDQLERTLLELARQRDSFEAVIDSMAEGVVVIDGRRRIVVVNPAAARLLAITGDVRGRQLLEVARIPALSEALDRALAGESPSLDVELDVGGVHRQLLARATPQGDSGGAVLVVHDVTEIRRLETMRRDFVANVSHELRTPVSIIQANSETLMSGALDNRTFAERFIEAIERNAARLDQLISDLLDISRIDAGKYQLDIVPVRLADVTANAAAVVEEARAKRGAELSIDVDPALCVKGDPGALEQVLVNLIENAIKYGPEGGAVLVTTDALDAEKVRIEVLDEGPGIPRDQRSRVFERFYRVDPGRSRNMGGTGLGLAIVKNLTEAMGGLVGVEPREPTGSCFWVIVARAPDDSADDSPS